MGYPISSSILDWFLLNHPAMGYHHLWKRPFMPWGNPRRKDSPSKLGEKWSLYTPHTTLYLYTLHFTPYTLHSTLYTTLHTLHSTLYTSHSTLHTPHFTLHTLHSTLYTPHFTPHTLHSTLHSPHLTLYTLHSTLNTPLSSHPTLCTPPSSVFRSLQCTGR